MKRTTLLAALLAAACAKAPEWQKPGASHDAVAMDMLACRMSAPIEPAVRGPRTKPGMGGGFNQAFEREGDRMLADERHVTECMRAKGYSDANTR